jgi:putative membrane protein
LKSKAYEYPVASPPEGNASKSGQITLTVIIILFHLVGLIGFSIPLLRPLFLKIVPWHLLLMLTVLIVSHKPLNSSFIWFVFIIFVTAFIAEWIGIHTGWLFGNYTYGNTLGLKLGGVPLTIGINWFLLIYSAGVLLQRARVKSAWVRIVIGALILVLLDVLIEPVAMRFNYWQWTGNSISIKNYVCWFAVSAVMLFVFQQFNFKKQSPVAAIFLFTQFVFFIVLLLL